MTKPEEPKIPMLQRAQRADARKREEWTPDAARRRGVRLVHFPGECSEFFAGRRLQKHSIVNRIAGYFISRAPGAAMYSIIMHNVPIMLIPAAARGAPIKADKTPTSIPPSNSKTCVI
jgi:hypothetical protein